MKMFAFNFNYLVLMNIMRQSTFVYMFAYSFGLIFFCTENRHKIRSDHARNA